MNNNLPLSDLPVPTTTYVWRANTPSNQDAWAFLFLRYDRYVDGTVRSFYFANNKWTEYHDFDLLENAFVMEGRVIREDAKEISAFLTAKVTDIWKEVVRKEMAT